VYLKHSSGQDTVTVAPDKSIGLLAVEVITKPISAAALFHVKQSFAARSWRRIWEMDANLRSK
jgi:hypothetical protein